MMMMMMMQKDGFLRHFFSSRAPWRKSFLHKFAPSNKLKLQGHSLYAAHKHVIVDSRNLGRPLLFSLFFLVRYPPSHINQMRVELVAAKNKSLYNGGDDDCKFR